jgi:hypothetical protein
MLDQIGRRVFGNGVNVSQRLGLDGRDAFLSLGHLGVEFSFCRNPFGFRRSLGLFTRGLGDCRRLLARIRQFLLVGSDGVVGLFLQAIGFVEILGDPVTPVLQEYRRCAER